MPKEAVKLVALLHEASATVPPMEQKPSEIIVVEPKSTCQQLLSSRLTSSAELLFAALSGNRIFNLFMIIIFIFFAKKGVDRLYNKFKEQISAAF